MQAVYTLRAACSTSVRIPHSQTRTTVHSSDSATIVLRRSRPLLISIFSLHSEAFGPRKSLGPCTGQPCQKHPSTKTATRYLGRTKSALQRAATRR